VWSYDASLTVDQVVTTPQGTRRFSVAPGSYHGRHTWMIAAEGRGTYARSLFADTLIVTQDDLQLLRYAGRHGMWAAAADSATRFLSWRAADVGWLGSIYRALFQLERLDRQWRGSVYLPWRYGDRGGKVSYYPLDMRVDGEEQIAVPAGRFDTWRVAVQGRRTAMTVWVSKESHWVVKIAIPSRPDAVWEQALVSISPLPPR